MYTTKNFDEQQEIIIRIKIEVGEACATGITNV